MVNIASEMNLSETAYARPLRVDDTHASAREWSLRWFTPSAEVDLCGHATLATAHVIFAHASQLRAHLRTCAYTSHMLHTDNTNTSIEFTTRSGKLIVQREQDGQYRMDFPAYVVVRVDAHDWPGALVPPFVHQLAQVSKHYICLSHLS
jgi:PhzF family phenazine biosynthesis protein